MQTLGVYAQVHIDFQTPVICVVLFITFIKQPAKSLEKQSRRPMPLNSENLLGFLTFCNKMRIITSQLGMSSTHEPLRRALKTTKSQKTKHVGNDFNHSFTTPLVPPLAFPRQSLLLAFTKSTSLIFGRGMSWQSSCNLRRRNISASTSSSCRVSS